MHVYVSSTQPMKSMHYCSTIPYARCVADGKSSLKSSKPHVKSSRDPDIFGGIIKFYIFGEPRDI